MSRRGHLRKRAPQALVIPVIEDLSDVCGAGAAGKGILLQRRVSAAELVAAQTNPPPLHSQGTPAN